MTKLLSDYCVYIEDHMPKNICNDVVNLFESADIERRVTLNNEVRLSQLNFTRKSYLNEELHKVICQYLLSAVDHYRFNIKSFYAFAPRNLYFEHFRIKRYISEDADQFDTHVDVGDVSNECRYLSFMWYLNDVVDGGETEFTELDFKIQPKAGALMMFPPIWMFPHKGHLLNSGKKYLLSTYLLYPEATVNDDRSPEIPRFKLHEGFQQ